MSWVEVGKNPWEVSRLREIGRTLWKKEYVNDCFDPFLRPWMWVNFKRKIGGCLKCSQFLRTNPLSFGKKSSKAAMRYTFSMLI